MPPEDKDSAFSVLTPARAGGPAAHGRGQQHQADRGRLFISPKTVETHRLRIMNKLDIDNVALLTKYAIQEGLTPPEP